MSQTPQTTTPADADHPHSIFGASGAKRWRTCPGSVHVIQKAKAAGEIPQNDESEYASEGTQAHDWAEKVLTGKCGIEELPDEFRIHLEGYINHCKELANTAISRQGQVIVEGTVPLFYRPEDEGTLDFGTVTETSINFVDLKYGAGVKVEARDNDQLAIYLLSLVHKLENEDFMFFEDDTPVILSIYQPRHHSFDGEPDTWKTTLRDLKDFGIDIERDYQTALKGDETTLKPHKDACRFCDVKGICSARAKLFLDPMVDFEDESEPALKDIVGASDLLTPEQIAFIVENGSAIKKFIGDVEKQERSRLEEGGEIRQLKLVEDGGLGPKKWKDEKAAETFLKGQLSVDERYQPRKLITAPQAFGKLKTKKAELSTIAKAKLGLLTEKEAEKCKTECLFHREPKKPSLVPVSDERPAMEFKATEDEFEDETCTGDAELDDLM